ncbi:uncharacterized protein EDB93DRAFT_538023 [Suillus bovinus]|uniref:uncharacterized protein n=1 Tax=Suillus bovinus TaxID=48563 RepID=UPI001B85DC18|nr:uncharacterized protein EDB93DRAFT_538023 [Suillus bovinus]KAG2144399.1 hypothetical protein EDB93DRAFT_538023 [Suillus bovinus]
MGCRGWQDAAATSRCSAGVSSVAVSPDEIDIMSGSHNHAHDTRSIRNHDLEHLIRFSLHPGHALVDTATLLDEIATPTQDRSEPPVRIREHDRWAVVGPENRLLFWVPPNYDPLWCPPRMQWVVPPLSLPLDLSHMAHGLSWESCYGGHNHV